MSDDYTIHSVHAACPTQDKTFSKLLNFKKDKLGLCTEFKMGTAPTMAITRLQLKACNKLSENLHLWKEGFTGLEMCVWRKGGNLCF